MSFFSTSLDFSVYTKYYTLSYYTIFNNRTEEKEVKKDNQIRLS